MTEKHYAHLALSYVADTIRTHLPTLGIEGALPVDGINKYSWHPPIMLE